MATRPETAQYIVDQLAGLSGVWTRRMFGEYAVYLDTKVVGFICDDQFFLKPTDVAKRLIESPSMGPPYPGAKLYYLLTDELEQRDHFKHLVQATANALPLPKAKSSKTTNKSVKSAAGKTPARKDAAVKPTAAKKAAMKAAALEAPARKAPAKKVPAKKAPAKKAATRVTAKAANQVAKKVAVRATPRRTSR